MATTAAFDSELMISFFDHGQYGSSFDSELIIRLLDHCHYCISFGMTIDHGIVYV